MTDCPGAVTSAQRWPSEAWRGRVAGRAPRACGRCDSGRRRWAARTVAVASLVVVSVGCTRDSRILCGRWQSRPTTEATAAAPIVAGGIELYLGHYGPDVVGVARLYPEQFGDQDDCGINVEPVTPCGCVYIENGVWRHEAERLTFAIDGTSPPVTPGASACLPPTVAAPPEGAEPRVEFDLRLEDEDRLVGTVGWVGRDTPLQPVVFDRLDCALCVEVEGESCP